MRKLLVVLAVIALAGCQEQGKAPQAAASSQTTPALSQQINDVAAQVAAKAEDAANASAQAVAEAEAKAQEVQAQANQASNDLVAKAKTLLTQAQDLLNQGKFDEAISAAQQVLSFDPNNIDAQKLIELAKEKLAGAGQKAVNDAKTGLMNTMNNLGK